MAPTHTRANIIWLDCPESTNIELKKRFGELDNLSVIAAKSQTSGKGQGDHTWYSVPGKDLTFSIYCTPDLPARDIILITCVITLAIRDYLLAKGVDAGIKWPNDIWVEGRKICGILIENSISDGKVKHCCIGVGLNLFQTEWPDDLPNPVSLKELTGIEYDPETELEALYDNFCRRYAGLGTTDGRNRLQEEFGKYMFRLHAEP